MHAVLNYLVPMAGPVRTWACEPPPGVPRFNGTLQAHRMPIGDARTQPTAPDLDTQGFTLCEQRSRVHDFWDPAEIIGTYYAEVERLLCDLTGARHARVFDHTLRRRAPGRPPLDGSGGSFAAVREPVGRVHADYTPRSAPARLRQVLGEAEAARRLSSRFAILGLWRPTLAGPLRDAPLALADARSVGPHDMVPNELIYADRRGETFVGVHNPAHRWFFFPGQRRNEVIVFKNFDSAAGHAGIAGVVPHTAFEDPTAPADAPRRESIEVRAFVFFEA